MKITKSDSSNLFFNSEILSKLVFKLELTHNGPSGGLINLSLSHFWRKTDEKRFSVRICSHDIKYLAENRNAYILRHSLRVTTAGPDGRF